MAEVKILVTPNHIKTASSRAAEYLGRLDYDALFLNFSRDLERGIKELAEGAPYDCVLDRLRELKLIPEPTGSWLPRAPKVSLRPIPLHPLEILAREIRLALSKGSTLPSQRIIELIEQHAQFIREYVTLSENYDDAYRHWMWDMVPWLRRRMTLKPSVP